MSQISNSSIPNAKGSEQFAYNIRAHALEMISASGASHIGSVYSVADLMAVLFSSVMQLDPENPQWEDRDRFVLSKGHAGASVYVSLAERGFFDHQLLSTYYTNGSTLSGHVSHKNVPGVDISTGSLGHGLGIGAGMAMASRKLEKDWRSFVVLSDGECDEGSIWEAALFAAHNRLGRLTTIIDYNKIQSLAPVSETMALEPFRDKWEAFGWQVRESDGHDHAALKAAMSDLPADGEKPLAIIAHTTKGKGVSFFEERVLWHYRCPRGEELEAARADLAGNYPALSAAFAGGEAHA
ncbi:MAG: transketolase [Pseudomonadota bacterium]